MPKPTPDILPFFYSTNNSKFRPSDENVKQYLKFVKNISITYPVMIPSPEAGKPRDGFRKLQKQKEKSRDVNSNRNNKQLNTKTPQATTIANAIELLTLTDKDVRTTGKDYN